MSSIVLVLNDIREFMFIYNVKISQYTGCLKKGLIQL